MEKDDKLAGFVASRLKAWNEFDLNAKFKILDAGVGNCSNTHKKESLFSLFYTSLTNLSLPVFKPYENVTHCFYLQLAFP